MERIRQLELIVSEVTRDNSDLRCQISEVTGPRQVDPVTAHHVLSRTNDEQFREYMQRRNRERLNIDPQANRTLLRLAPVQRIRNQHDIRAGDVVRPLTGNPDNLLGVVNRTTANRVYFTFDGPSESSWRAFHNIVKAQRQPWERDFIERRQG